MIIEQPAEIQTDASLDETVRIMGEMDRLLNEMKDTMRTIKRILGEDSKADEASQSSTGDMIHGS